MTLGSCAVISASRKQQLNTRRSTEEELVETDDVQVLRCGNQDFYLNKDMMSSKSG